MSVCSVYFASGTCCSLCHRYCDGELGHDSRLENKSRDTEDG